MASDILQRGYCTQCGLAWVLGRLDPQAGLYGKFFCAACWDKLGFDDGTDDDVDDESELLPPCQKRSKLPDSEGSLLPATSLAQGLKISPEVIGSTLRRRLVHVVSDPMSRHFKGVGNGLWIASKVLANCLEDMLVGTGVSMADRPLADTKILELGAGVGFLGIGLAQLGAQVVLTDIPDLCPLLQLNVSSNFKRQDLGEHDSASSLARVLPLRWGDKAHIVEVSKLGMDFDFILGSDVGYNPDTLDELFGTISSLRVSKDRGKDPARVVLAIPKRPGEHEAFEEYLAEAGWTCEVLFEIDMAAERGDPTSSEIVVLELHQRAKEIPHPVQSSF